MNILPYITRFFSSFKRPYPIRDWFSLLVIILVIFLMLVCYAGYLFFALQSGGIILRHGTGGTPITLTRNKIETTLDIYRERKVNFDSDNLPKFPLIDPAVYAPATPPN